jgi:hypothetical protein
MLDFFEEIGYSHRRRSQGFDSVNKMLGEITVSAWKRWKPLVEAIWPRGRGCLQEFPANRRKAGPAAAVPGTTTCELEADQTGTALDGAVRLPPPPMTQKPQGSFLLSSIIASSLCTASAMLNLRVPWHPGLRPVAASGSAEALIAPVSCSASDSYPPFRGRKAKSATDQGFLVRPVSGSANGDVGCIKSMSSRC